MSGIKDALSCQLGGGDISIMLISSDTPGINATHTSCYSPTVPHHTFLRTKKYEEVFFEKILRATFHSKGSEVKLDNSPLKIGSFEHVFLYR